MPHIEGLGMLEVDDLGHNDDGIAHLTMHTGFSDRPDIPAALLLASHEMLPGCGIDFDPEDVTYFLSRASIQRTDEPGMPGWRTALFMTMANNAADPARYFNLPIERTVTLGFPINL